MTQEDGASLSLTVFSCLAPRVSISRTNSMPYRWFTVSPKYSPIKLLLSWSRRSGVSASVPRLSVQPGADRFDQQHSKGFDIVSLYKHQPLPEGHEKMSLEELRKRGCYMTEDMWLHRILFLETTAVCSESH